MMTVTKVKIIEKDGRETDSLYIHSEDDSFHLFIDKYGRIRTHVQEYIFISETPIIKI